MGKNNESLDSRENQPVDFASLDSLEGVADRPVPARTLRETFRLLAPGLSIVGTVALAASWLSDHYGAPVMLFALLLGMAINFTSHDRTCRPGIDYAARTVLRVGVALLGARVTLAQVESLGLNMLLIVILGVVLTVVGGAITARRLGLARDFGILTGGAVAICGASAALAIASILPPSPTRERDTILTVVGVTTLSTIAMVLYPLFAQSLGFNDRAAGLFLGATIHDVAQVVGAGYSISKETGDTATIVKLFRVALLLPTAAAIGFLLRAHVRKFTMRAPPLVPFFLVGFASLVAINSTGIIPETVAQWMTTLSRWFLVIAISALGTKTKLGEFIHVGWKPIILMVSETTIVCLFVLIATISIGRS